ncbi:hypothetical protein NQ318_017103 [Aromia moschata]|uniref:Non-structural maintenance of chromosomes element 1 homolog n=1 Tax=Aromia moschata TaxID=1265417 RepID=A0AAV8Y3P0_9CUCU|nr:hypothetical protein NQ318_017103 [Aromia moschata]
MYDTEKIENLTQFKTLVIELNREISKQYYKISFITCEVTNQNLIVWVNTKNDDISKYQITYSALELEYFHAILQEILSSEEHRITFIVCINITSTLTSNFSRDNGQKGPRQMDITWLLHQEWRLYPLGT